LTFPFFLQLEVGEEDEGGGESVYDCRVGARGLGVWVLERVVGVNRRLVSLGVCHTWHGGLDHGRAGRVLYFLAWVHFLRAEDEELSVKTNRIALCAVFFFAFLWGFLGNATNCHNSYTKQQPLCMKTSLKFHVGNKHGVHCARLFIWGLTMRELRYPYFPPRSESKSLPESRFNSLLSWPCSLFKNCREN
jgi:hypothetical protein